jgi:hypothetical protein
MEKYDALFQENLAFAALNTGFVWMKKSQVMADAWKGVYEMDLLEDSRDQVNLNIVSFSSTYNSLLGTSLTRYSLVGAEHDGFKVSGRRRTRRWISSEE